MLTGLEGCLPGTEFSRSSDFASGRHLQGRDGIRQRGRCLLLSSKDRGRIEAWGAHVLSTQPHHLAVLGGDSTQVFSTESGFTQGQPNS